MASPLIHSADLRTVGSRHPECLDLMLNEELLAVNQDPAGKSPKLLFAETNATGKTFAEVNSTQIIGQVRAACAGRNVCPKRGRALGLARDHATPRAE